MVKMNAIIRGNKNDTQKIRKPIGNWDPMHQKKKDTLKQKEWKNIRTSPWGSPTMRGSVFWAKDVGNRHGTNGEWRESQ